MKDPNYLKSLIAKGKISEDDIKKKSFRNKDMGECELIAIAKVSSDEHQIVTNDKGRVFYILNKICLMNMRLKLD